MVGPYPVGRKLSNGVEAVTVGMVDLLAARDDTHVEVITTVFGGNDDTVVQDGVTIHTVGSSDRLRRATLYMRERSGIAAAIERMGPDVVHAQGANFYGLGALKANLPTVVTLHGMLFKEASIVDPRSSRLRQLQTRLRGEFNARFERQVLEASSHIVTISEYVNISIDGRTSAALSAIGNPISSDFFDLETDPEPGRILCVARIEPRKGQHELIEMMSIAAAEHPELTLRLVGKPVDAGYTASIEAQIEAAGLSDRVELTGVVDDDELLEEYRRASIVVLSSREETSPMVFQQAMAAGIPVVGPANAGIPHLVTNDETGIVVPGRAMAAELAEAVVALSTDADLRHRLGSAGREVALDRFTEAEVGDRTVAVYREALQDGR